MIVLMKLIPYRQVGDFVFGMERSQAEKMCGKRISTCMYGYPVEDRYLDDYGYMHTLCNNRQLLEAVEFFPDISTEEMYLEYDGVKVCLSKDIQVLLEQLHRITDDLTEDEDGEGYTSQKLGLKVYCPDEVVEDVLIHDQYCYDEEKAYIEEQKL